MLDDKTRALLGDREAQRRFTERGEMLPCNCGSEKLKLDCKTWNYRGMVHIAHVEHQTYSVRCNVCHARGPTVSGIVFPVGFNGEIPKHMKKDVRTEEELEQGAKRAWNDRPPILTPEQIKKLDGIFSE